MKHISDFNAFNNNLLSENLSYHFNNGTGLLESVFRVESEAWLDLVNEARILFNDGKIGLTEDEIWLVGTDAGKRGIYEGREVLLDIPFEDVEDGDFIVLKREVRADGVIYKMVRDNISNVVSAAIVNIWDEGFSDTEYLPNDIYDEGDASSTYATEDIFDEGGA